MQNKKQRVAAIAAILAQNPNKLYSLNYFQEFFGCAKSSVSEDVSAVRQGFAESGIGKLETVAGAKGGVRFLPLADKTAQTRTMREMAEKLSDTSRILPGGYIYIADLFFAPQYVDAMARVMAGWFAAAKADLVVTVETKGVPLAMGVARILGLPLAIARRESKLTDGPTFSINYLSGSSRRLQTMSLSKRMLKEGKRALVIDDFLSGGGTAKALCDMLAEFEIEVVGTGIAIANKYPQKKKVKDYRALFLLEELNDTRIELVSLT